MELKNIFEYSINENVSKNLSSILHFTDFGDFSLDFKLFFWTDYTFYEKNVKSDIHFGTNKNLRKTISPSPSLKGMYI